MTTFGTWFSGAFQPPAPDGSDPIDVWPREYRDAAFPGTPGIASTGSTGSDLDFAWHIHVELRTRIATQAMPLHSGQEEAALTSLHALFGQTRDALHKHGAKSAVTSTVLWVLNEKVRPVTAYWHGVIGDGNFGCPDEAGAFRSELLVLQDELRLLADFLGYAIKGTAYHTQRIVRKPASAGIRYAPGPLRSTTEAGAPSALMTAERRSIERRRSVLGVEISNDNTAGIALSGGGIRSATFSLGVLTALSRAGLYHQLDYLSTVSGGGYIGALISTWATAKDKETESEADPAKRSQVLRDGPFVDDAATEHLRDRSRYLIEGGLLGTARAALPMALGTLTAMALVLLTSAVTLPLAWLGPPVFGWLSANAFGIWVGVLVLILGAAVAMRSPRSRPVAIDWSAKVLVFTMAVLAPSAAVTIVDACQAALTSVLPKLVAAIDPRALLAVVPAAMTALGALLRRRSAALRIGLLLLAASPWVAYAIGLSWLASQVRAPAELVLAAPNSFTCWVIALLVAFVMIWVGDVNEHSPLGYYRDRLAATYCVTTQGTTVLPNTNPPAQKELTELAPIHLVNATVNLPASRARNDRGRGAANMVFSRHGWSYPTESDGKIVPGYAADQTPLNVDLAMAISGAAVSPLMGTLTPSGASPWLTLLNLRLNAWLPNPAKAGRALVPQAFFLLHELLGLVGLNSSRLNVSDGGHFENLGVYELIRRRCRYIVAIDGEADPELACGGLMNLIKLARVDFGANIQVDPRKLKLNANRFSQAHVLIGSIIYRDGSPGALLYLKLSVTGDEPAHLLAYRAREPIFPHHSTGDQVFSEEQFECYRALGQHLGESLFRTELVGDLAAAAQKRSTVAGAAAVGLGEWFERIDAALNRRAAL